MTDDLKRQFEQLVADPPPPSAVPSETVFARVRTVRRRRTAGVVTLVAAAVVAVAVAAGNLTDINSSPPVTHTPSAPVTVVTGPPTNTPTTSPSSTPSSATTTTKGTTTGTNVGANTSTPGTHTPPPARPQLGVHIVLKPVVQGRDVTMRVTLSGRALVPSDEANKPLSTSGTDFLNLLGGTLYKFGDGYESGSDAGAVNCLPTTKTATGPFTYSTETHTFTKPGTYTLHYQVKYCGNSGWVPVNKTAKVTVK